MNLLEVKKTLEEMFNKEPMEGKKRNLVFWYDDEGEFAEDVGELRLDNAKILKIKPNNSFYIKYLLEKEDKESNYLLYSPMSKPLARDNWLLDILKYNEEFSADRATLIMKDLKVGDSSLRNIFKGYLKFFGNKERYRKFASFHIGKYTKDKVHIGVLSTLCRLPVSDFEQVLKKILLEGLDEENKYLKEIESFGDTGALWYLIEKRYGYTFEERSLEKLMIMLLISHLSYCFEGNLPTTWQAYISAKRSDAIVFVSNFMNHASHGKDFDSLADRVEEVLNLKAYLDKWDMENYIECDTFRAFDKAIIDRIKGNLLEDIGEFARYRETINKRRTSHWFETYKNEYEALYFAISLLEMEKKMGGLIKGQSAHDLIEAYTKEYYFMDYFYRKFYFYYDRIFDKDPFIKLKEKIENTYTHWYLNELSIKWSAAVQEEILDDYSLPGIKQQGDFYQDFVSPFIRKGERIFVIISDGLRYEAGKELLTLINQEARGMADIEFMQGVIPSATKYGMASLLPRKEIRLNDKGDPIIDGISSQGTINRGKIISNYSDNTQAISFHDMKDMRRVDYKEVFDGKKLIYIYHDTIDAVGEVALTEREVFEATEKAFKDLVTLIKNLINHLSATNIIITADHGFIYRRSQLTEVDKISSFNTETIDAGRRYLLAEIPEDIPDTLPISMKYLLGEDTRLKAILPKGMIRYKVQGPGANYVHGGASLQEIILPVIKFKNIRKDKYRASKVQVKLTNISRKITNRITYLEFFQIDLVEDKRIPLRLKLYFVDKEGNRISNENIIIADSKSKNPGDRTYREKFTLRDMAYDKNKEYFLILEDEDETVEKIYEKIPFIIDLLFSDDFGL